MINKNKVRSLRAFTLSEFMIALLITSFVIGGLMSLWYFTLKSWGTERVRSKLRSSVEINMERIKDDIRLSSSNQIYYYPADTSECTAISLAVGNIDVNGFLTVGGGGITWNRTVVYHLYHNDSTGKDELRRTLFWPRDNSWSTAQFQNQINSVATSGNGEASKGAMNTATELVFSNDITFRIVPQIQKFDLFSANVERSNAIDFGSVLLSPGAHTLRFEVLGKNALATGYNIGIDCIILSPSGGVREVEAFVPSSITTGRTYTVEDMSAYANFSGNNLLKFNSTGVGDYVSFSMNYDSWVESNFKDFILGNVVREGVNPYLRLSNKEESGPDWTSDFQTGVAPEDCATQLRDTSIRTIINNDKLLSDKVAMVRVKFRASSTSNLKIERAYISEKITGSQNAKPGTTTQLYFSDLPINEGTLPANPGTVGVGPEDILINSGQYILSNWAYFVIDKNSNSDYLVTFYVTDDAGNCYATYWPAGGTNSYTRTGDHASEDDWASSDTSSYIYAVSEIQGWSNEGTATSTIYDTKLAAPDFSQLSWTQTNDDISLLVRTSNDYLMTDAPDWSTLTPYTTNPLNLSSLDNNRYIQFQVLFNSAYPYDLLPKIDNCIIDWPGDTALVDISGYFSKGPQYGIFKLVVDGVQLVKGVEIYLAASQNYLGTTYNSALEAEVSPRNSGK